MSSQFQNPSQLTPKAELRKLNGLTWYYGVKVKAKAIYKTDKDISDYKLDEIFGYGPKGEPRLGSDRLKIFESIKSNFSVPSKGNSEKKRNFDLVDRVETTDGYQGTEPLLRSPFWKLLEDKPLELIEVREYVIECIKRLDLVKDPGNYEDDGKYDLDDYLKNRPDITFEEMMYYENDIDLDYDKAMTDAFSALDPSLDLIALTGFLALEAILAGNIRVAKDQIKSFERLLSLFCNQPWLSAISNDLYLYAEKRMQNLLYADALNGLPDYMAMVSNIPDVNLRSPAVAFLKRHQRILWRR